jgi:FAD/FMN-containing dehydrogenase
MIGSEGMLGVVTEVTVKLLPKPQLAQVVLAAFDDVAEGRRRGGRDHRAGIIPAGLEMMDQPRRRGRAVRASRLPTRRRGDPALRIRRHAGGSRRGIARASPRRAAAAAAPRRDPRLARRGRAAALLVRAQGGVPAVAGSRPTTTAWTARSRASAWPRCCAASPRMERNTGCAARTSSTPATATCIR